MREKFGLKEKCTEFPTQKLRTGELEGVPLMVIGRVWEKMRSDLNWKEGVKSNPRSSSQKENENLSTNLLTVASAETRVSVDFSIGLKVNQSNILKLFL